MKGGTLRALAVVIAFGYPISNLANTGNLCLLCPDTIFVLLIAAFAWWTARFKKELGFHISTPPVARASCLAGSANQRTQQSSIAEPPDKADKGGQSFKPENQEQAEPVIESPETQLTESEENSRQEPSTRNDQSFSAAAVVQTELKEEHAALIKEDVQDIPSLKRSNYFVRHWRGDLSLVISYWVNGLLGTFLVLLTANTLGAMQNNISLTLVAALSLLVYATAIVASIWQLVGVWRSASNHVSRGGNSGWASLAKGAVIFGVLNCLVLFCRTYIPQSVEMVSIIAGDKRLPPYEIRVLAGGTEVEFRGGLRAGCAKELERILSAIPQAKVLHIESPGGRIGEAKRVIQLVRDRGLTTYTSERCLSAATLVLMSGKERVVAAGAKVGFHAGKLPGATAEQQNEMANLVRKTMESAGVSEQFISRVLVTPSEQMWYPTFDEMLGARVVTSQSLGERFATSWDLSGAKLDAAIQNINAYPLFSTIRELEPEAYAKMMTNFVTAIRSGKSEGEAVAAISEVTGDLMEKYLPAASDEALLALREQWVGILSKYKDQNSRACIAVFTQAKINYSRAFPDWDMTNTLRVVEKVMRSGASRVVVPVDKKLADEDLAVISKPLGDKYGSDLMLLQNQARWMEHSQKVCDILLTMYQQIETLPDKREANLIRYLVTSKDE